MKLWRLLICILPLLAGCSMLSGVTTLWHKAAVSETGVDGLTADTPMESGHIADALRGNYQLLGGMQTHNGKITPYIEARKAGNTALEISGDSHGITRITVLDPELSTDRGVKIGTAFGEIYQKAYNVCHKDEGESPARVLCKAPDSQHLSYQFTGAWQGAESLLPADDVLKHWTVSKIIWQRQ